MSEAFRHNRKNSDRDILRLNSLGLSLSTVAAKLGCHATSITLRLKSLKVPPADTRRAFMEDIFNELPEDYQNHIADAIERQEISSIKHYVRDLISADVDFRRGTQTNVTALTA